MKVNTYLIVIRYLSSGTSDRRWYVTMGCERGGVNKPRTKPGIDDEKEEVQVKRRGPYGIKSMSAKLTDEQLTQTDAQKIYNVVVKIKKNRMQGRNTVEEVLCLSAQRVTWYNMPLLEVVGITPTSKNFTVATAFMRNEQATTYR
ncbi:hypothetical protein M9H77_34585 [Catharanthus roseus]|uniref:Uncharacterized protein n=1 Tax=Catharanthus roseus TaxID=4058 RepID=A0ACB9ZQ69_CATRO|nr:hypothetical protein M9H77_34585 [Catharanthus roseus]